MIVQLSGINKVSTLLVNIMRAKIVSVAVHEDRISLARVDNSLKILSKFVAQVVEHDGPSIGGKVIMWLVQEPRHQVVPAPHA